jgi:hypothetical protein
VVTIIATTIFNYYQFKEVKQLVNIGRNADSILSEASEIKAENEEMAYQLLLTKKELAEAKFSLAETLDQYDDFVTESLAESHRLAVVLKAFSAYVQENTNLIKEDIALIDEVLARDIK